MKFKSMCCLGCSGTCAANGSQNKEHSVVKATVSEYVRNSSIHGVAYVGDDERNKFERLGWLVMLVCSFLGASYSIYQAYRTMKDNPIIQSPSLGRTPRWEIPFPAVTVCPVSTTASDNFTSNITYWPDSMKKLLPDNRTDLTNIGFSYISSYIANLFLSRSDQNDYDILTQVLPEIEVPVAYFYSGDLLFDLPWRKTITADGACVTFNMYPEKTLRRDGYTNEVRWITYNVEAYPSMESEWSFIQSWFLSTIDDATHSTERLWSRDTGFNNDLPQSNITLPIRSFSPHDYFVVKLRQNNSIAQRLHQFESEFTVYFHAPDETPQYRDAEMIKIKSRTSNFIDITPHLVVSEGIEHYEPEVRQCYYYNERYLKFYKGYTQHNCETECFANFTLAQCNCVHYHTPHFGDTKLCLEEYACGFLIDFYSPDFTKDDLSSSYDKCNCLPSCTQLLYKPVLAETTTAYEDLSVILINHSGLYITKDVRTELHSISEFLSNCGGALGLFLGVSIFSIIELVYFCTVRLYLNIKRKTRRKFQVDKQP